MDKNIKKQSAFISEEENTLSWEEVQNSFKKLLEMKSMAAGFKNLPLLKNLMII